MGSGNVPQQMKDAILFIKSQIGLYDLSASNTVFTGHSLGGAIAESRIIECGRNETNNKT